MLKIHHLFNCVHSGLYDEKFIDSLIELIEMMPKYGIKCFIDPHQDCWSRFSGGSGAPGWTFEAAGLDLTKFKATGAAYVHNVNRCPGDSPPMVWPTNYTKLGASTMFTLFWAGDTFAPNKMYRGESIQQFLQNRYLECYAHLARYLFVLYFFCKTDTAWNRLSTCGYLLHFCCLGGCATWMLLSDSK